MSALFKCALRDISAISKSSCEWKGCQGASAAAQSGDCGSMDSVNTLGRSSLRRKCRSGHLLAGWYKI